MSDGPHKSLPMRPGWKRFAERADKAAFDPDQIAQLCCPALEGDWQEEVAPHLGALREVLGDNQQGSLFGSQNTAEIEALRRRNPGNTLWRTLIDAAACAIANGRASADALLEATASALLDRAARGVLQVEEHYLRRAGASRAAGVRTRLEEGLSRARIDGLARRLIGLDSGAAPKQVPDFRGLDDGVTL
jgi:hypothetical protein